MLRTNLATRPFYNERAVRLGIASAVALVAALTAFNVAQIVTLSQKNTELMARVSTAEARSRSLREQAGALRKTVVQGDIALVQAASREANLLIERRAFSWTDLFNRFEETLPANVRIAAVQPQIDEQGRMLVAVTVISKRVEDLDSFIEELERTRAFRGVLSRQDVSEEDGLRSVIQGYYGTDGGVAETAPAGAAETTVAPGNASPSGNNTPPVPKTTPSRQTPRSPGATQ
jgi:hypothetical protein